MRGQRAGERLHEFSGPVIDDVQAIALHGCDCRKRAHLAEPLAGAERQVEPGRIGAIDDVHVVISRQHDHPFGKSGMTPDDVEKFGPLGRAAGIRQISGDEDEIQWLGQVRGLEAIQDLPQAIVAPRTTTPAFDAEAVALADHVEIGKMGDPPVRPPGGAESKVRKSRSCFMLASATPQTSEATAR